MGSILDRSETFGRIRDFSDRILRWRESELAVDGRRLATLTFSSENPCDSPLAWIGNRYTVSAISGDGSWIFEYGVRPFRQTVRIYDGQSIISSSAIRTGNCIRRMFDCDPRLEFLELGHRRCFLTGPVSELKVELQSIDREPWISMTPTSGPSDLSVPPERWQGDVKIYSPFRKHRHLPLLLLYAWSRLYANVKAESMTRG